MVSLNLLALQTESRNPHTANIDTVSTTELCRIINSQDALVAAAVEACLPRIAEAIDRISERVRKGGRMFSFGAGTSGRLGVLDASELPPTFHASPAQFIAIIAGGDSALRSSIEGAEDSPELGAQDLLRLSPTPNDVVLGIASSGSTPYVLGALRQGHKTGCLTIGLACTRPSEMGIAQAEHGRTNLCNIMIECVTGAEVVTGSTRLRAGTATKMILNMISTGIMIKLGKTYGNFMVDLRTSNTKLQVRARNIILFVCPDGIYTLTGIYLPSPSHSISEEDRSIWDAEIDALIGASGGSVKLAILVATIGSPVATCKKILDAAEGVLAAALKIAEESKGNELAQSQQAKEEHETVPQGVRPGLVLCIDGGGTKTAAVIAQQGGGVLSRGEAGMSNFTAVGLTATLKAIQVATNHALASLPSSHIATSGLKLPSPDRMPLFAKVWAGIAGVGRPADFSALFPALAELFSLPQFDGSMRLTNDGFLLAAPIQSNPDSGEGVVVIAGTGSIAISFRAANLVRGPTADVKRCGDLTQLRRSGGWGHLLGDEGSAFMTGRSAIRTVLAAIDNQERLLPWHKDIIDHFGAASDHQLISCVTAMPHETKDPHEAENVRKAQIATASQIVFRSAFEAGDRAALDVVRGTARELVRLITPLTRSVCYPEGVTPAKGTLSLGGGLMRQKSFRELLLVEMKSMQGWEWSKVEVVDDAAVAGALQLAGEVERGSIALRA